MPFCRNGWLQKLHYLAYCCWVLWMVISWRPSWIYASDPLSCPLALLLSWVPNVKLLYHEHDSPQASTAKGPFDDFLRWSRRALARRAEICILPNATRLMQFRSEFGPLRSAACVWNCPGIYEVPTRPRSPSPEPIWVLYHGSIVRERLSPAVLDALAQLDDRVRLRVVGYETAGSRGYVGELKRRALSLGIENRIEFLDAIPRSELLPVVLTSDIGLALLPLNSQDLNFQAMPGASNKAFDYMACGLAVLVSDLPDWREMFVQPGYALACNPEDPHSIASAIRVLIEAPGRMRAMGEKGRQRILSEWNYENVFRPVLEHLSRPGHTALNAAENRRLGNTARS
jgi:glycosyltransferase involved in cell wall biosynthesis